VRFVFGLAGMATPDVPAVQKKTGGGSWDCQRGGIEVRPPITAFLSSREPLSWASSNLGFVEHDFIEGDHHFVFTGCKDIAPLPSHEICHGGKVKCVGYRKSVSNDTGYDDHVDGFFFGPFVGNANQNSLRVGHFSRKYGSMRELSSRCWDSSFITERESRLNILDPENLQINRNIFSRPVPEVLDCKIQKNVYAFSGDFDVCYRLGIDQLKPRASFRIKGDACEIISFYGNGYGALHVDRLLPSSEKHASSGEPEGKREQGNEDGRDSRGGVAILIDYVEGASTTGHRAITARENEWWRFFFGFLGIGGLLTLYAITKR
jgi:hypothetical protein